MGYRENRGGEVSGGTGRLNRGWRREWGGTGRIEGEKGVGVQID